MLRTAITTKNNNSRRKMRVSGRSYGITLFNFGDLMSSSWTHGISIKSLLSFSMYFTTMWTTCWRGSTGRWVGSFWGVKSNFFLFVVLLEDESRDQYRVQCLLQEGKMEIVHHKLAQINEVPLMYIRHKYNGKPFKKTKKSREGIRSNPKIAKKV